MAEKPKMPNADGRRSKRAQPPTIDLTATEVSSAPAAGEMQAAAEASPAVTEPVEPPPVIAEPIEPPPPEPPEPPAPEYFSDAGPEPELPPQAAAKERWFSGPALAAGLAGALIVSAIMAGLWLSGLVPIRYAGSTAMRARVTGLEMQMHDLQKRPAAAADTAAVDALNARVAKLEAEAGKIPPSDTGVNDRLAAADNTLKSVGVALAALGKRSDDAATNASEARARAEAAEKAVMDLRAGLNDVAKDASAAVAPAELDVLQKRVAALEQSSKTARDDIAKTAATDTAVRLTLSAVALRNAVASGVPFAAELAQVKSLSGDAKALAPLESFAAAGVPSQAKLADDLRALLPAMVKISGTQTPPAAGFLERLQANAGKLVRIRPVDAPAGDDAAAVLARVELASARGDIAGALNDLAMLPEPVRAPAQDWIARAQARQAALTAARTYAVNAARGLGPR